MGESEINQLQLEWRRIVLDKLEVLEKGQANLAADIVIIKTSFVQHAELKELREKISILEEFKYKFVGSLITLQIILSSIGYVVAKLIK